MNKQTERKGVQRWVSAVLDEAGRRATGPNIRRVRTLRYAMDGIPDSGDRLSGSGLDILNEAIAILRAENCVVWYTPSCITIEDTVWPVERSGASNTSFGAHEPTTICVKRS